jgi:hypothetical protein
MDEFMFGDLVQHGCWPAPMWQSPAIFLQQAISPDVIFAVGRQASTGVTVHKITRETTTMRRNFLTC